MPPPPTITPLLVAELLVDGERWPVYVHVIDHPAARVLVDTGMTGDVDAGEVEGLLAQWDEAGVKVGHLRVQLRHARCRPGLGRRDRR